MKAPRLFISSRKGVIVLFALALVASLSVSGVVLANHYSSPNAMGLGSREFHYLERTLVNGDPNSPVTFTGVVGENIFTIKNESKTQHIVEFEKITGTGAGYEVETGIIRSKGGKAELTVNLTSGTWKVYCPLHDTGKKKMLFYLFVP